MFEFTKLLKKNPYLLAKVLPSTQSAPSSAAVCNNKQTVADDHEQSEEPDQLNVEAGISLNSTSASYSSEDLLRKRSRNGKSSGAQQTFRVSELSYMYCTVFMIAPICGPGSWKED